MVDVLQLTDFSWGNSRQYEEMYNWLIGDIMKQEILKTTKTGECKKHIPCFYCYVVTVYTIIYEVFGMNMQSNIQTKKIPLPG